LEVDNSGLEEMDKSIILTISERIKGGPVGLNTFAVAVNEDPCTLDEGYDPFLLQQGFIQRTPRGREATDLAYVRFNKTKKTNIDQDNLFD
jgi:Holliday junction DNA helicase RuvB